ncbi:TetR/AcrR family transcriptional regulator [uncultured Enterococcus sp.]|uniref:TetR/AcrR family transcriptional regulator n=1 Tax=uncultured Enterococcus sp. TaxID=167972 RepID=UPI002AA6AA2B|nr:TetR/AcrR family transcriptional regulator [uncultured Enterococcus sp.]
MKNIDPRFIRAEERINQTFTSLLQKKEFNSISIKEITEGAKVNRSTFYAHYQDKKNLLDTIIEKSLIERLNNVVVYDSKKYPSEFLWSILLVLTKYIEDISSEWGIGFLSVIPFVDTMIRSVLSEFLLKTLVQSKELIEDQQFNFLTAISLSSSLFSIVREAHIRELDLKQNKQAILDIITDPLAMN